MDLELLVTLLDLAGTFAFALVGARIAANKGLDYLRHGAHVSTASRQPELAAAFAAWLRGDAARALLQARGLVHARPQRGFFVREAAGAPAPRTNSATPAAPPPCACLWRFRCGAAARACRCPAGPCSGIGLSGIGRAVG